MKNIRNYIKKCESCQKNKSSKMKKQPMLINSTAHFWKGILGYFLPVTSNHNKYLLTFTDDLTKYSLAISIPNQEASTIAESFVRNIVLKFGCLQYVLADQGQNFLSEVFKDTCKLLKNHKIQTSGYRSQSNGSLERSHRNLTEYLRCFINKSTIGILGLPPT